MSLALSILVSATPTGGIAGTAYCGRITATAPLAMMSNWCSTSTLYRVFRIVGARFGDLGSDPALQSDNEVDAACSGSFSTCLAGANGALSPVMG